MNDTQLKAFYQILIELIHCTGQVKVLTLEKETLRAEVEIYRAEAALPSFSKLALGQTGVNNSSLKNTGLKTSNYADFISPGNGIFPNEPIVTITNPHGMTNPLCCALHPNDSILATGGADSNVSLSLWGRALQPSSSHFSFQSYASHVKCTAPVITLSFASSPLLQDILAVGCMDGSVEIIYFSQIVGGTTLKAQLLKSVDASGAISRIKHNKYIKSLAWSSSHSSNILVTASADGIVHVSRILPQRVQSTSVTTQGDDDTMMMSVDSEDIVSHVIIEKVTSFFLQGAVETLCFLQGGTLCLYEHNTPYLTYFDLADGNKQTKYSLNGSEYQSQTNFEF